MSGLKLRAEDAEDLAVIAACLQDAVGRVGEMAFVPAEQRFAAIFVRQQREAAPLGDATLGQVTAGLHFDAVTAAKLRGIDRARPERLIRLITIMAEPASERLALRLLFHEGAEIRLEVDRLICHLQDLEDRRDTANDADSGEAA